MLRDDESGVELLRFTPDGTKLASGSSEGPVRVWALDLDDLIALAQERLTRGFTAEECRQYLHVERCPTWATPAVASAP